MGSLIPSLRAPATVGFDAWGIPHAVAGSRVDLYRLQGFLHARARGWQMEMLARFGRGRAAEVLGEAALPFDVLTRRLGLARAAEAAARTLATADLRILEPYAEGVLAGDAAGPPAPEYEALGIERNWRATLDDVLLDTCAIALLRAFVLSDSWRRRLAWAWFQAVAGGAAPAEVTPLRAVWAAFPAPDDDAGSNAFAVAGSRTATGAPLLAGDLHLKAEAPSALMEMHLRCPDLHVTGASVPGLPNIVAGRNERVAWAITSSQADVADCYRERVDRERDAYLAPQGWTPLLRRTEVIGVRGEADEIVDVEETRNGPLITSNLDTSGEAVSLRWVHTEVASPQRALEAMNEAGTWSQFRAALGMYSGVGLTVVYADADGVVARQQAGPVPQRAAGHPEPRLLCGWTGEDDWLGRVPFEQLAATVDPPDGIVCAANDDPGPGSEVSGRDWDWNGRAARMIELLSGPGRVTLADCRKVQLDLVSPLAAALVPVLLASEPGGDQELGAARAAVAEWDLRLDPASTAAAVFDRWYRALVEGLLPGEASPELADALAATRTWWSCRGVPFVLGRLDAMQAGERATHATEALRAAVDALREDGGEGVVTYGRLTETSYQHLLGSAFSIGPVELPGGVDTLWRGDGAGHGRGVPTLRQIADLGDADGGLAASCTGNSGVPGDPHYADQVAMFLEGGYRPWPLREEATAAGLIEEVRLT